MSNNSNMRLAFLVCNIGGRKTKAGVMVRNNSLLGTPASLTISMMSCSISPSYLPKIHKWNLLNYNAIVPLPDSSQLWYRGLLVYGLTLSFCNHQSSSNPRLNLVIGVNINNIVIPWRIQNGLNIIINILSMIAVPCSGF